jgi:hypothetical protein
MIDHSKKLLTTQAKHGDGSARSPVVTGQPDEARRRHEPTRPVRGDSSARRRSKQSGNARVQPPVPAAVTSPESEDFEL